MRRNSPREILLDSFIRTGDDKFQLANVIGDVAKHTKIYTKRGDELTWYVVTSNGTDDVIKACPADPMKNGAGKHIKLSVLRAKGSPVHEWPKELWDEVVGTSKIMVGFIDDDGTQKILPVTSNIGGDFANIGITGPAAQRASYHLLGLVAEQTENKYVTLVARSFPGKLLPIEKVIAMRSDRFAYIPQDEALALASEVCSDGDIEFWNVDNFFTEVVYAFPMHAVKTTYGRKTGNFIPYIRYYTSDAGDGSCSFELGWNVNSRSKVFLASGKNRVFRTHRGEWNDDGKTKLARAAEALKDKFVIVQQKLDELSKISVLNQNIERVVRNLCSDVQIKTKTTVNAMAEYLTNEFRGVDPSAAEIIISMIEAQDRIPELIDLSNGQRNKLNHQCGELLYQRIRQHA